MCAPPPSQPPRPRKASSSRLAGGPVMGRLVLKVAQTPARPTSFSMAAPMIQGKLVCGGQPSAPAMTHLEGGPGTDRDLFGPCCLCCPFIAHPCPLKPHRGGFWCLPRRISLLLNPRSAPRRLGQGEVCPNQCSTRALGPSGRQQQTGSQLLPAAHPYQRAVACLCVHCDLRAAVLIMPADARRRPQVRSASHRVLPHLISAGVTFLLTCSDDPNNEHALQKLRQSVPIPDALAAWLPSRPVPWRCCARRQLRSSTASSLLCPPGPLNGLQSVHGFHRASTEPGTCGFGRFSGRPGAAGQQGGQWRVAAGVPGKSSMLCKPGAVLWRQHPAEQRQPARSRALRRPAGDRHQLPGGVMHRGAACQAAAPVSRGSCACRRRPPKGPMPHQAYRLTPLAAPHLHAAGHKPRKFKTRTPGPR